MVDRRLVLSIAAAIVALATGVLAVVISQPALGVVAGAAGVVAGAAGAALAAQLQHTEIRLASSTDDVQRLHRELDAVAAILEEEANRRDGDDADLAAKAGDHAFDQTTGLYDERYFAVLVQQQVAAARRSLRPISVVIFEIDGLHGSDGVTRDQALGVVGDVVRRTLRESDSACRLGELMVGAILEDTSETGAVWAAERVRGTLLGSPVGDSLTVSAGVACYPTHALGAAELVAQAGKALDEARRRGADRVETAPEA
jgi:diguanylate cyclase (GGDEF)-like protein